MHSVYPMVRIGLVVCRKILGDSEREVQGAIGGFARWTSHTNGPLSNVSEKGLDMVELLVQNLEPKGRCRFFLQFHRFGLKKYFCFLNWHSKTQNQEGCRVSVFELKNLVLLHLKPLRPFPYHSPFLRPSPHWYPLVTCDFRNIPFLQHLAQQGLISDTHGRKLGWHRVGIEEDRNKFFVFFFSFQVFQGFTFSWQIQTYLNSFHATWYNINIHYNQLKLL